MMDSAKRLLMRGLRVNKREEIMNKVTMQDIADELGVSRVTVWKVFNNYSNVSSALRERVLNKAKELGYTKGIVELEQMVPEKNISLIVSRPNSSSFWTNIIHRMAQELSFHNINLVYTYMPSGYSNKFKMPAVLANGTVQGAIILNLYDEKIVREINQLNIPKVFLDTVPQMDIRELRGDLVLLEGRNAVHDITRSVIDKGLKKVGFIGDIHYAQTNRDRYEGYLQCMEECGLPVEEKFCLTHRIGIFSYSKEITRFLDSLDELPEAFICVSDYVAHILQLYFSEHKERIPEGIVATGYDGRYEYDVVRMITTADVRTEFIGKRLAMQIMYRMEHEDAPYEKTFIEPLIVYRDSILYG